MDPNRNFPWERLAEEGFGYWYDESVATPDLVDEAIKVIDSLVTVDNGNSENWTLQNPEQIVYADSSSIDSLANGITPELALRVIGYNTTDLDAAIRAFKLHFIQDEVNAVLTERDLKILYNLSRKYL